MKTTGCFFGLFLLFTACNKTGDDKTGLHPRMIYKELADAEVKFDGFAALDIDGDGQRDIHFGTMLVGDPIYQHDKRQWLAISSFNVNLPVNTDENIPVLDSNDLIPINNFSGYNWYNASGVLLAQKVISVSTPSFWQGAWRDASHRFIPLQVNRNGLLYNGWVEVSFDKVLETLILHKAALSEEPNKAVTAGK